MKIKSHIRSVQLIFSIFMFLIFAGLTGCKDDGAEFLEKELVQEESTETSGVDLEQEDPTDAESGVSEKKSEEKQVDTVQETAAAKQQPEISEIPETIYVDICGAVTSPGVYELPYGSRVFQAIEKAGGYLPENTGTDQKINLNTADVSQLTTLTGVGESKALAIIAYREENGPFTSIEDIMNVPGIKEGTYEKIKDKIAIK